MEDIEIKDYEDFAEVVSDEYQQILAEYDEGSIGVIAKYKDMKNLAQELVVMGYDIYFIDEFGDYDITDYNKEYLLQLDSDGIMIRPLFDDECGYDSVYDETVFVMEDCNHHVIDEIDEESDKYMVFFADDEEKSDNVQVFVDGKEITDKNLKDKYIAKACAEQIRSYSVLDDLLDIWGLL